MTSLRQAHLCTKRNNFYVLCYERQAQVHRRVLSLGCVTLPRDHGEKCPRRLGPVILAILRNALTQLFIKQNIFFVNHGAEGDDVILVAAV